MRVLCLLAFASCLLGPVVTSRAADPAAAELTESHENLVILLDSSGSMAERMPGSRQDKMTTAKTALKEVLKHLAPSTHIGVLVFGGGSQRTDDWVYPLGPRNDPSLHAAIDRMRAQGGTPLGAYLKRAADRLLEERARQLGYGTYRLLVVSDGEAQDSELVNRYVPQLMARGITLDVIGVAMAKRHTLATRVHSYRTANDAESLSRALREVLAEIGGATGQDITGAEAFAALEPLPIELAAAALQALTKLDNRPIGDPAVPASDTGRAPPTPAPPAPASPPSAQAPPPAAIPIPPTTPTPPASRSNGVSFRLVLPFAGLLCIGFVFLFVFALARVFRGKPHRRR